MEISPNDGEFDTTTSEYDSTTAYKRALNSTKARVHDKMGALDQNSYLKKCSTQCVHLRVLEHVGGECPNMGILAGVVYTDVCVNFQMHI